MPWLLALGVPLLLLVAWWPAPPKPRPALPNPNGYDYFVKAGEALAGMWTNSALSAVPVPDLQVFLSANQKSLELVREGLRHRSLSPVSVTYDSATSRKILDQLGSIKRLGVLLAGEGRLAELNGNPEGAVDGYVEAMRFGQECSRGGVMVERLTGRAIEHIALTELRRAILSLNAKDVRRGLADLQKLDASHDLPSVNLGAEAEWVQLTFSAWERFMSQVHPRLRKDLREVHEKFTDGVNAFQAARRRAIVEAAARLFELEKGRRPTGYADLVPAYLKAIPLDPATGKEIAHPF